MMPGFQPLLREPPKKSMKTPRAWTHARIHPSTHAHTHPRRRCAKCSTAGPAQAVVHEPPPYLHACKRTPPPHARRRAAKFNGGWTTFPYGMCDNNLPSSCISVDGPYLAMPGTVGGRQVVCVLACVCVCVCVCVCHSAEWGQRAALGRALWGTHTAQMPP
jgi:hypothetical protein